MFRGYLNLAESNYNDAYQFFTAAATQDKENLAVSFILSLEVGLIWCNFFIFCIFFNEVAIENEIPRVWIFLYRNHFQISLMILSELSNFNSPEIITKP